MPGSNACNNAQFLVLDLWSETPGCVLTGATLLVLATPVIGGAVLACCCCCRGPFPGARVVQAHMCGRLPRDTLVAAHAPEVPSAVVSTNIAYFFRYGWGLCMAYGMACGAAAGRATCVWRSRAVWLLPSLPHWQTPSIHCWYADLQHCPAMCCADIP